ncbi:hypothetical protein H8958_013196 [Nasalis larvatus]
MKLFDETQKLQSIRTKCTICFECNALSLPYLTQHICTHPFGFLDLHTMLLDEYQERLFVGGRDLVYSLSLERISDDYKEIHWPSTALKMEECIMKGKDAGECANYVRVLHHYNRTHLLTCGTGAFDPVCAFIRVGYHLEMAVNQGLLSASRGHVQFLAMRPCHNMAAYFF